MTETPVAGLNVKCIITLGNFLALYNKLKHIPAV